MKHLFFIFLIFFIYNEKSFSTEGDIFRNERVIKTRYSDFSNLLSNTYNVQSLFGDTITPSCFNFISEPSDILIENDTRKEVLNVSKYPYNCVGLITAEDNLKNASLFGTAFKISYNHILTAAHNLMDCDNGKRFFKNIQYHSAFNKGYEIDSSEIKKFFVPEDYCNGGCDIAIIELMNPINPKSSLPILSLPEKDLIGKKVRVIGYPGDLLRKRKLKSPIMFEDIGKIIDFKDGVLFHDANTYRGNSGGPVIVNMDIKISGDLDETSKMEAVAVHIGGGNLRNCATMIDEKNFYNINKILSGQKPENMEEVNNK